MKFLLGSVLIAQVQTSCRVDVDSDAGLALFKSEQARVSKAF